MFPIRFARNSVMLFSKRLKNYRQHCCISSLIRGRAITIEPLKISAIGSSKRNFTSKGDSGVSSFYEFLKAEIEAEKQIAKSSKLENISGFDITVDQRIVKLSKKYGDETITVYADVNHSVVPDESYHQAKGVQSSPDTGIKIISLPDFIIEITHGDQKLVLECSFAEKTSKEENHGDLFELEKVYLYADEGNKKFYAVTAAIFDGTLYDHLMNYLDHRGINNAFAEQLSDFCTYYEHKLYVSFLHKLKDFIPVE